MSQIGDNTQTIDFAAEEVARLEQDYGYLMPSVEELRAEAGAIGLPINDDDTKATAANVAKRARDQAKTISGLREMEKAPHMRRAQGVDQFFFRLEEALARRDRKGQPGIYDTLLAEISGYDNRVLAAEQERRRLEAERLRKEAEAKARAEEEARRKAQEAADKAARARKDQEAKEAAATEAAVKAAVTSAEATTAIDKAEEAYIDTLAKPADIMRSRGSDGTLTTMKREPYAEIVDAAKLDAALLWPFISLDAKEKALRTWARSTGHTVQMDGAAIGFRNKSQVR